MLKLAEHMCKDWLHFNNNIICTSYVPHKFLKPPYYGGFKNYNVLLYKTDVTSKTC